MPAKTFLPISQEGENPRQAALLSSKQEILCKQEMITTARIAYHHEGIDSSKSLISH